MIFGFMRRVRRRAVRRKRRSTPGRREYLLNKEAARALVHARLEHFNAFYTFTYNKVFIKNSRTRWGSCSSNKNLNFNFRIVKLTPELVDYLIVHELCHLKEMNHGPQFWALVAQTVPEYKILRAQLRQIRL